MRRLLCAALLLIGCAPIQTDIRTERGPTLGTSTRQSVSPNAGVQLTVTPHYPEVTLGFQQFDGCRTEQVETYAEEQITEKSAPSAGPALSVGVSSTLSGAALLIGQGFFSNTPDTSHLNSNGQYGPSTRQLARNWGYGLLIVGVPALIEGVIDFSRTGTSTETRKVDQVVGSTVAACHQQPVNGHVQLLGMPRQMGPRPTENGQLTLHADELKDNAFESIALDDRTVTVGEPETLLLDAFFACTQALPPPAADAPPLTIEQLRARHSAAEQCNKLSDHPAQAEEKRLAAEIEAREELRTKAPAAPEVTSFDQALQAYPPKLTLAPGSPDLEKLSDIGALVGTPVLVQGLLVEREGPNIVVVRVGTTNVLVFLASQNLWATDFPIGARVEAVAIISGTQKLGALDAPLVRAIWMRTGISPKASGSQP